MNRRWGLVLLGLLWAGPLAAQSCLTSSPAWPSAPMAVQRDSFALEYDDTPAAAGLDAQTALSARPVTAYAGLAVGVRFNLSNTIDALNDGARTYQALVALPYTAGTRYHVRLRVNVRTHRYSAWVTPPGSSEILLGQDYGFRLGQDTVAALGVWTVYSGAAPLVHTVCNFTVRSLVPPPPDTMPPPPPPPVAGAAWDSAVVQTTIWEHTAAGVTVPTIGTSTVRRPVVGLVPVAKVEISPAVATLYIGQRCLQFADTLPTSTWRLNPPPGPVPGLDSTGQRVCLVQGPIP